MLQYIREGVQPGTTGFSDRPGLPRTNLTLGNVGTATAKIVLTDPTGATSEPLSLLPGAAFIFHQDELFSLSITGNGASVNIYAAWPGYVDEKTAVTGSTPSVKVTGTVSTTSTLLDSGGNTTMAVFGNGTPAPADGNAVVYVTANGSATITLSDGTTTKTVGTGDGASWLRVPFPVVKGVTYTFAATGLAFLGGQIYVGP